MPLKPGTKPGTVAYPVKIAPGKTAYVDAKVGPQGQVKIIPPKRGTGLVSTPLVNSTLPNPRILERTAKAISRQYVLNFAKPGDPEPYVYGYTAVKPYAIGADDSGDNLVVDFLLSRGEIESIEGNMYMPDVGSVSIAPGSPIIHETFLGATGQTASAIMTALKGSYDTLPNRAHVVLTLQLGWNLNILFFVEGRLVYDPRVSPMVRAYSANPALMLADMLLVSGYDFTASGWDSVADAADAADALIGSPGRATWTIGGVWYDRNGLADAIHSAAQYAHCFVDRIGSSVWLIPDAPRSPTHTVGIDDIVDDRSVSLKYRGSRNQVDGARVIFKSYIDRTFTAEYGTLTDPGKVTQVQMPLWADFNRAKRHAEWIYNRANQPIERFQFVGRDASIKLSVGDVGTVTYAPRGLSSQAMVLVENEQVSPGRWRRTYEPYDAGDYPVSTYSDSPNSESLRNPYAPPDGPEPTLTHDLVTSSSPNYYRIKIDFSPVTWAYLESYYVTVTTTTDTATILYEEVIPKGSETGSPLTITTYTDFAMSLGNSPQTVYEVKVYCVSITEAMSATPGEATITDPVVVYWNTDPLTSWDFVPYGNTATAAISFDGTDSEMGGNSAVRFKYSSQCTVVAPLVEGTFSTGQYLVMYDNITEIHGNDSGTLFQLNSSYQPGTWVEADGATLRVLDQTANSPQREGQVYSCDLHFAQNDGGGSPVVSSIITKPVTLASWADDDYIMWDSFTGTNGTDIEAHAPDVAAGVSPSGWDTLIGSMGIASNKIVNFSATSPEEDSMSVIDVGVTDVCFRSFVTSWDQDFALVGRVQDASNFWQLKVEGADGADPVLKLIEISGGTPTTRASVTMTGKGPIGDTAGRLIRLTFSGNDILGQFAFRGTFAVCSAAAWDAYYQVTYTSSSFNTETRFGIQAFGDSVQFDSVFASDEECPWMSYIDDN